MFIEYSKRLKEYRISNLFIGGRLAHDNQKNKK